MRLRRGWMFVLGVLLVPASMARGQGLIIDRAWNRPVSRPYEVRAVEVDATVRDQVAEVRVAQTFHNPGSTTIDAEYLFPLPEEGAIEGFVLMVDGKELPGRLLPKEEARRIYEEIVRSRRDPALLEYVGRGAYRASVFPIPAGADRTVTLRYTQLCRRDRDVVEFAHPLGGGTGSGKPVGKLAVRLQLRSRDPIKSVYSPTDDATIRRDGDREATVTLDRRDVVPNGDFRLVYTLAEGAVGAHVLSYRPESSEDGYFLLLASPAVRPPDATPPPKSVVFVIDRSGSMAGKKMEQARSALASSLNNLRDGDSFAIVAYDDRVETFSDGMRTFNSESRAEAARYVANLREGGSTNIDGALKTAFGLLKDADRSRPAYVVFMTDGLPTAGETKEVAIAANARSANTSKARLFAFGVGYDVNARLLDRLGGGNAGTSEYVKPDDDIERAVGRFTAKLTSPALANLSITMPGTDLNRTYPRDLPDLFDGGQLAWVGRYTRSGPTTLRLEGQVGGDRRSFEFPVELAAAGRGPTLDYVAKLWATRRIGDIIDQIDLHGPNKELTDELVSLGTKHGILTPYTSFLADERVQLHAAAANSTRAGVELKQLGEVSGMSGVVQRGQKQAYNRADRALSLRDPFDSLAMQPAPAGAMGRSGGGGMGLGSAYGTPASGPAAAKPDRGPTVRNVGDKTFFRKGNRWVDTAIKPEDESKAVVVEQFGDAFFDLVRSLPASSNRYLSFDDAVTVELDGKIYQVDPAKP